MIVHSDAIGSMVFFLVMVISALMLDGGTHVLWQAGNFALQARSLDGGAPALLAYTALTIAVSLLLPQKVVNPGQSYCVDSWCIGIQQRH